ncbi:hypothetical protein pEaSNUABM9_00123 [Erwinia phage pEa_SNUABM_9]|nr:hypothetical protein pEaSNUABM9_00123 [Erwinia phage pEa_SNUABM_9]
MNLYIITDEFNKSAFVTSFRATVVAKDENSARWLVSQRNPKFQITEVAGATVFCVGELQTEAEGVLTIVHDNGARLLATSQLKRYDPAEETFYEIELFDDSIKTREELPCTEVKWFAVKNQPKYVMSRRQLFSDTPKLVTPGLYSQDFTAQQFFLVDQRRVLSADPQWRYKPAGEEYKSQFFDLYTADLLEIRAAILRSAECLPGADIGERLLRKLWGFVRTEKGEGAIEVKDLSFFPGQKLYWMAEDARVWAMTLPQIIAGTKFLDPDAPLDIPGTNCQTF